MKSFIFALTFILAPCAVNAGELLPDLYAKKFCDYRAMGISVDDSRTAAVEDAYIESPKKPIMINYKGRMVSSDVLKAVMAAIEMCPKFVN